MESEKPIELLASRVWSGSNWHYPHIEAMLSHIDRLRDDLADAIKERDEARREACWQYARRNGRGYLKAERSLAEQYALINRWDCFKEGGEA